MRHPQCIGSAAAGSVRALGLALLLVAVGSCGLALADDPGGLVAAVRRAGRGRPEWLAYSLPMVEGHGFTCCLDRRWRPSPCKLEVERVSWGSSTDDPPPPGAPHDVEIYLRVEDGRIGRVRSVSAGCPVDPGGVALSWLPGVSGEESVELLAGLVERGPSRKQKLAEEAIPALALHADPAADRALADLGSATYPAAVRENAYLWLGTARRRAGYEILVRLLAGEGDPEMREKLVFGLSQSPEPEAPGAILRVAETDRDPEVRGQALFWLAQTGAPIAPQGILRAIERDADGEVREKAVFALSQLPDKQGTLLLIDLLRRSRSPEIRRQALFWLGQSDDPRALDLIADLLEE
jgi:hypothetical protein